MYVIFDLWQISFVVLSNLVEGLRLCACMCVHVRVHARYVMA